MQNGIPMRKYCESKCGPSSQLCVFTTPNGDHQATAGFTPGFRGRRDVQCCISIRSNDWIGYENTDPTNKNNFQSSLLISAYKNEKVRLKGGVSIPTSRIEDLSKSERSHFFQNRLDIVYLFQIYQFVIFRDFRSAGARRTAAATATVTSTRTRFRFYSLFLYILGNFRQ